MTDPVSQGFEFGFVEGLLTLVLVGTGSALAMLLRDFRGLHKKNEDERTDALQKMAAANESIRDMLREQVEFNRVIKRIEASSRQGAEQTAKIRRAAYSALEAALEHLPNEQGVVRAQLKQAQRELLEGHCET